MKLFVTIQDEKVHLASGKKVIPADEFSTLFSASDLVEKMKKDTEQYRLEMIKEGEVLKEEAEKSGFANGLEKWNEKLLALQNEIARVQGEMENSLVPLAMAAVKKIIGREIETKPETIVDIISTALKAVSHHKRIALFVNKNDLEILEKSRPQIKAIFDHLQSLTISARDDMDPGECVIETEAGIVNVGLDTQLQALEKAFHSFVQNREKKK